MHIRITCIEIFFGYNLYGNIFYKKKKCSSSPIALITIPWMLMFEGLAFSPCEIIFSIIFVRESHHYL